MHRAQLTDLDRDLAEGRLASTEHTSAQVEVQRRLLRAAEGTDPETAQGNNTAAGSTALAATLGIAPAVALALYLIGGKPGLPSVSHAEMVAVQKEAQKEAERMTALGEKLREKLQTLDPKSEQARKGYVMLGELEAAQGNLAGAAVSWQTALDASFDPTLAARTADVMSAAAGRVTPEAAALFRRALAAAPPDAPWRRYAEQRLAGTGS